MISKSYGLFHTDLCLLTGCAPVTSPVAFVSLLISSVPFQLLSPQPCAWLLLPLQLALLPFAPCPLSAKPLYLPSPEKQQFIEHHALRLKPVSNTL